MGSEMCIRDRGQAYWNEDGIFSGHTSPIRQIMSGHTSPFCRGSTDLVLTCGKSHALLRGTSSDYGSWSNWAYYSLDSRGLCLGHSVLPLPCENRRLSMGFSRDIYFFQFKHTDGLYESQYRCILLVLLQVGMTGYLSFLGVQRAQHADPPKRHCVAPYSRMFSRLSLSKATALTRYYGPPLRVGQQQR